MNVELFKSTLRPYWSSWGVNDLDDAADKIATAYELSNIGDTAPFFGAKLIKGDKDTLKQFLSLGLQVNFHLTSVGEDSVEPGFTLMATGFCLYWLKATWSPVPPMPPMIAPTTGVQVLVPGLPKPLDSELKKTFKHKQSEEALSDFSNALVAHLLTVAGIYSGLFYPPGSPSPVPLVLPWAALLSLPSLSLKVPDLLKNQDTDGDGIPDYLDDDIDNDGIPNDKDDDKDGDGILNKDEPGFIGKGGPGGSGTSGGGTGTSGGGTGTSGGGTGTSGGGTGTSGGGTGTSGGGTGTSGGGTGTSGGGTGTSGGGTGTSGGGTGAGGVTRTYGSVQADVAKAFEEETTSVFNENNQFGLTIDLDKKNPAYMDITLDLYEWVTKLQDGSNQYQFATKVTLTNLAFDRRLGGSQSNLPITISNMTGYSFRDTIETNNSIFYGSSIISPRLRGIELMKAPYKYRLGQAINDSLQFYVNKWYKGILPSELKNVYLLIRDNYDDPTLRFGVEQFYPLDKDKKFKSLS
jgi:hypothetical protein